MGLDGKIVAFDGMRGALWMGGAGFCLLRREVTLSAPPKSARLRVIADPHTYAKEKWMGAKKQPVPTELLGGSFLKYRLVVNGALAGAGPLRPVEDEVPVLQEYDVTALLKAGANVLGVFARGEHRGVMLELDVDGEPAALSGPQWRQFPLERVYSPVCWRHPAFEQMFKGGVGPGEYPEHIDGTRFPFGWETPGYDDSRWEEPCCEDAPPANVEAPEYAHYELRVVQPASCRRLEDGAWLVDFGRECVAGIELAAPGGEVELRLGEELLEDGHVRYQMRTFNCYQECWTFPKGGATLRHFGLRAFRYAELLGLEAAPEIRAVTVTAPFDESRAEFRCAEPRLEALWGLCRDTMRDAVLDVFVDCPSRERIAYEADNYIAMRTHFAVGGDLPIVRRTLRYQLTHPTWPMEWRQFVIPLFHEYALHSGDLALLDELYPRLAEHLRYEDWEDGLVRKFPMNIIVDWPEPSRDGFVFGDFCNVPNAFVVWNLRLMAEIAAWLGRDADAARWRAQAAEMAAAFNRRMMRDGLYVDNPASTHSSLHANLFPAAFGLLPADAEDKVLDFLVSKGMACSVYAAQFLLDGLYQHGRAEAATKLLLSDGPRSWLNMLGQGAVCTLEAWSPKDKPNASFAHPWGAAPANLIVRHLLGVRPLAPGWRRAAVRPRADFDFQARLATCLGPLVVERKGGALRVEAPAGMTVERP